MNGASQQLDLEPARGVDSSEALVNLLINERYLVGLDFHHDSIIDVSMNSGRSPKKSRNIWGSGPKTILNRW